jgi:hypothetical protein
LKGEAVMDDFDYDTFVARGGNLYTRKGLCPPVRLREYAIRWYEDGIDPEFCLAQIKVHLEKHSGWYRCGSGDKGMEWVGRIIREKWLEPKRPPGFAVLNQFGEWFFE